MFCHAGKRNFTPIISSRYQPLQTIEKKWWEVCHCQQTMILSQTAWLLTKMPEICQLLGGAGWLEYLPMFMVMTLGWKVLLKACTINKDTTETLLTDEHACLVLICIIRWDINLDNSTIYWRFTIIFKMLFATSLLWAFQIWIYFKIIILSLYLISTGNLLTMIK